MFEKIKAMGDLIKGGIANFKACEQMDKLTEKARNEYKAKHRPADNAFYLKYKKAAEKAENAPDTMTDEEKRTLTENKEAAQVFYLAGLTKNDALPADFRNEIQTALEEYKKSAPDELFQNMMLRLAKTEQEKKEVQEFLNEEFKN